VPLFLFLFLFGANEIIERILISRGIKVKYSRSIIIAFCLISISSVKNLSVQAGQPYPPAWKNYMMLARWSARNTPEASIISCRKGPLYFLYSGRKTVKYLFTADDKSLIDNLIKAKANYVVVEQLGFGSTPKFLIPAIQKNTNLFTPVMKIPNPDTYLFKMSYNRQEETNQ
jgi:hypothetical protein